MKVKQKKLQRQNSKYDTEVDCRGKEGKREAYEIVDGWMDGIKVI
jgi:hypothetical protein